jgi:hypothetical protein
MSFLHVFAACPCCMILLLVLTAWPCCLSILHVIDACSCCMSVLHTHAACPCCISMLHDHVACTCCMSGLHVHGAINFVYSVRYWCDFFRSIWLASSLSSLCFASEICCFASKRNKQKKPFSSLSENSFAFVSFSFASTEKNGAFFLHLRMYRLPWTMDIGMFDIGYSDVSKK